MTTMSLRLSSFLQETKLYRHQETRPSKCGKLLLGNRLSKFSYADSYCQKTLHGHDDWVRALEVTDDGSLMASAGHDKVIFANVSDQIDRSFMESCKIRGRPCDARAHSFHRMSGIFSCLISSF
jgi:hypothetical protein